MHVCLHARARLQVFQQCCCCLGFVELMEDGWGWPGGCDIATRQCYLSTSDFWVKFLGVSFIVWRLRKLRSWIYILHLTLRFGV